MYLGGSFGMDPFHALQDRHRRQRGVIGPHYAPVRARCRSIARPVGHRLPAGEGTDPRFGVEGHHVLGHHPPGIGIGIGTVQRHFELLVERSLVNLDGGKRLRLAPVRRASFARSRARKPESSQRSSGSSAGSPLRRSKIRRALHMAHAPCNGALRRRGRLRPTVRG